MKNTIRNVWLIISILLPCFPLLHAQGTVADHTTTQVTAQDMILYTGKQATLSLNLSWPTDFTATGFQFDITLPEGVSPATDASAHALLSLTAAHTAEGSVAIRQLSSPANTYRVIGTAATGQSFSRSSDVYLQIVLAAAGSAQGGEYQLAVSKYLLTNAQGVTSRGSESSIELTLCLMGDVDRNFVVDERDVHAAGQFLLEKVTSTNNPQQYDFRAANMFDDDERITPRDIVAIIALTL